MATTKPITIAGGGLAGLTLGIGLRQRGVPVTLQEGGRYPRHRVCGEFISGRGQETLARFGLRDLLERAGAMGANTAAFFPQPNPPDRSGCLHAPFAFRVSPWINCSRPNFKSLTVNCRKANAGAMETPVKASFTPQVGVCRRSRAVRAGSG